MFSAVSSGAASSGLPSVVSSVAASVALSSVVSPDVVSSVFSPVFSSEVTTEELLAGERKTLVGIIIDATKYSVSIQTPEGISYYMTIPETGVSGNLDYITVGQIATFTYVGTLDETALLVGISDIGCAVPA